jgi:hypothetical protein
MSLAGTRSSQGDEYQLRVALHWLIQLLKNNSIRGIQVESVGLPEHDLTVTVDDVVVLYENGRIFFIQAKKNQPQHRHWAFSDRVLKNELQKAREQLESHKDSQVWFYSRSPFGDLKALAEGCQSFPDFTAFTREAPGTLSQFLRQLATIWDRPEHEAYILVKRLRFGPTFEFEDWDRQNLEELDRLIPRANEAKLLLERFLGSHQAKLRDARDIITRNDVIAELSKHGLYPTPKRSEGEILAAFNIASRIGRSWLRTVSGEPIPREELPRLIALIEQGSRTMLLTDRPGSGKTCLLLDLADHIEQSSPWGLLFIKGDQFANIADESELSNRGLPEDIVGQCARLAGFRRVVVIIDSLDVLSLSRRHSALQVFLGIMDRLERVDGVTVIAACRDFDLRYDPLLRGRVWQHTITLAPLDFASTVVPFLRRWEVNPDSLSTELRTLLQLPQNLRLFEKLAGLRTVLHLRSAHELYECFLEEVIAKDPQLGSTALTALQDMAEHLMQQRLPTYPKAALQIDETVVQRLISQEVLFELAPHPGVLSFSHQTLADSLIVRSVLSQNRTLADFILAHPQLPFIRPAVRAFFFSLRAHQPDVFRRQIWTVLASDQIAYHLKRLVSESLAEVIPGVEDWPLLRRLFQQYPDLFRRLLQRVESDTWFALLKQYWWPEAKAVQSRQDWLLQFIHRLRVWMNRHAVEVVALWREVLSDEWADKHNLIWEISTALGKFAAWATGGIPELLETLFLTSEGGRDFLGKPLSQWVQATNSGDKLLWSWVTKNIPTSDGITYWCLGEKLRCASHDFHNKHFLGERLRQSDTLLGLVLDDLERWSTASAMQRGWNGLEDAFLHATSWEQRHSQQDRHHVDSLTTLFDGLEDALKDRAQQNDAWWQANEPHWRFSREVAIRYLMIQAYKENITANVPGIEAQLTDRDLFRYRRLDYELGELMRVAYPWLAESAQTANQAMILSLYADEEWDNDGPPIRVCRNIYECLTWIPPFFRTAETQDFIDTWHNHFGPGMPQPHIYSSSGQVNAPLSFQHLLHLSNGALFRLLHHYNDAVRDEMLANGWVGGRDHIQSALREACSRHPTRFLALFPHLIEESLHHSYIHAVVDGIMEHLSKSVRNTQPSNDWEPVSPVPDSNVLVNALLSLLERYPIIWENGWTVSHAIDVCCRILGDPGSAERLTFLLFFLLRAEDPSDERVAKDKEALVSIAINSTRGVAAGSTMDLCNHLLVKDHPLPPLLPPLLRHYARDPAISVRVSILQRLPYLMYKYPELGWRLLADVFREPQIHLWSFAEQCFYHQYRDHFDMVRPYLDRLLQEGMDAAGDTWGRISALASLAGHISQEQLFETLTRTNANTWMGAAEVFRANLDRHQHTAACNAGLVAILRQGEVPEGVLRTIEHCFGTEANHGFICRELAFTFLDALSTVGGHYDLHYFLEWLGYKACHDPLSALDIAEALLDKLEGREEPLQICHPESLVAALIAILREADETDDHTLIRRAISLQDRFLKLDVSGMDDLLDKAEKS